MKERKSNKLIFSAASKSLRQTTTAINVETANRFQRTLTFQQLSKYTQFYSLFIDALSKCIYRVFATHTSVMRCAIAHKNSVQNTRIEEIETVLVESLLVCTNMRREKIVLIRKHK